MLAYIKDGAGNYTVVSGGKSYHLGANHPAYKQLVKFVDAQNAEAFERTINVGHSIEDWAEGSVKMQDGVLKYEDEEIHDSIAKRVIEIMQNGNDASSLIAFLHNLYLNPSYRAITELYKFMEHKYLPITADGQLLAYKTVTMHDSDTDIEGSNGTIARGDLVDKWTRQTNRNNLNDEVSMPRHNVTDDCSIGCGPGLHAGSRDYADTYKHGDKEVVIMVKINPKDVVSIPTDCGCEKLRCCAYTVVSTDKYDKSIVAKPVVDEEQVRLQTALKALLKESKLSPEDLIEE